MKGKRIYGAIFFALVLSCVFSFRETSPAPAPKAEIVPSARAETRRVVLEQRAIGDELQRTADSLEKDVDAIHNEICP